MEKYIIEYIESSYIGSVERDIEDFVENIFLSIYQDSTEKIAEAHFKIINFKEFEDYFIEDGCNIYELLDLDSQIFNFFESIALPELFSSDYYDMDFFKPFFKKKFKDCFFIKNRVGYLDTIKINENYQGLNIGSMVLCDLKNRYGYTVDFIGVKPYPLEYSMKSSEDINKEDFALKSKKVINFYKKNGYKQIAKSEFYMITL